ERILAAVVKGNAYGHGMTEVAATIEPAVDWFAVNSVDEARALHDDGRTKPILIMGATIPERCDEVVAGGFRQVVVNCESVKALAAAAARHGVRARVHVEVETGTNRLGVRPDECVRFISFIRTLPDLELEGVYTHFANIEDSLDSSYAEQQLTRYQQTLGRIEAAGPIPIKHTAASAAAMLYPQTHFNLLRMGVGLYGLWPSPLTRQASESAGRALELRPVLSWKTRVVHLNDVPMGETVGYGCTYYVSQPRRIATVPIGYYEGLDRGLSSRGPDSVASMVVRGCPAPIVGRISMDMTTIDVSRIPNVAVGDEVVVIGEQAGTQATADTMAHALDTINYEIVTRIGTSLPRVVV
ncbi:MAG: alanine racemase, partial [Dehalococcoidia bacterium]